LAQASLQQDWATGPLGKCLGEFPLRYATQVLIADLSPGGPQLNNGTATLLELESKKLAITCSHVIEKYRAHWMSNRRAIFQIGTVKLNPIAQILSDSPEADLATILLSNDQAEKLTDSGMQFFVPVSWPPAPVTDKDWIAVGGYPAVWRDRVAWDTLEFKGYSIGATPVTTVRETQIGCRFERDRWVWNSKLDGLVDPLDLGGMSGGPAFVLRSLHWELAGVVFEFNPNLDVLFLRPAHMIERNGLVRGPFSG
jgi:hypothetical protein